MQRPVLIPLAHLDGFHVWHGNTLCGAVWLDKWGWRWTQRFEPPRPLRFGVTANLDDAVIQVASADFGRFGDNKFQCFGVRTIL